MLREEASLSALFICWRNLVRHCRQQDAVHGFQSAVCWLPPLSGSISWPGIAAAGLVVAPLNSSRARSCTSEQQQAGMLDCWRIMVAAGGRRVIASHGTGSL